MGTFYCKTENSLYKGEWLANQRNGQGTIIWHETGEKCTAEFQDDKISGYGTFEYENGDSYRGTFSGGVKSGFGAQKFKGGEEYEGSFWSDGFEGEGTYTYKNSDTYHGTFRQDLRHGVGKMIYQKHNLTYEGTFDHDSMPKIVRIISTEENIILYSGSICPQGLRSGQGTEFAANGDSYVGHFSHDQRNGAGKLFSANNFEKYSGQWANGKKNGKGVEKFQNTNCSYYGTFENNVRQGYGEEYFDNGDSYEGNYFEGHKQGKGLMRFFDGGQVVIGVWKSGFMDGLMHYVDGDSNLIKKVFYQGGNVQEKRSENFDTLVVNGGVGKKKSRIDSEIEKRILMLESWSHGFDGQKKSGKSTPDKGKVGKSSRQTTQASAKIKKRGNDQNSQGKKPAEEVAGPAGLGLPKKGVTMKKKADAGKAAGSGAKKRA